MINPNFVIVGVLIQFFGGLSYVVDTFKGKIQPNRVSWLLWSIAPMIGFAAMVVQGVGIQALSTFIVGFVPILVMIASFVSRKAVWKITSLDIVCGLLSISGLILWYITKVGNVAIFFSIIADGLAAVPTVVKSFYSPHTESRSVFGAGTINGAIALLTVQSWSFQQYGFPLYLLLCNLLIFLLIQFKLGKIITRNYGK